MRIAGLVTTLSDIYGTLRAIYSELHFIRVRTKKLRGCFFGVLFYIAVILIIPAVFKKNLLRRNASLYDLT